MPHSDIHAQSGALQELLKDVRREASLTQVELAAVLEQSQSFVSKYESGERILDILEVRFVCERLGITLSEFCRRFEEKISREDEPAP